MENLSENLYGWLLNGAHSGYIPIFSNQTGGGHGQLYLLIFLLLAAIIAPLVFYFIIAKNAAQATRKNYIMVYFLGYFCLVVMNYFGLEALTDSTEVFTNVDMLKVCGMDFIYYSVIYELISFFSKDSKYTTANNIDLIRCWR